MQERFLFSTTVLGLLFLSLSSASAFERPKAFESPTSVQAPWVYRLIYVVDERGHLVLVRQGGSVTRVLRQNIGQPQKDKP